MKVDEKATKEARYRQIEGVNRLNHFFHVDPARVRYLVSKDQRWLSLDKKIRRVYQNARKKSDPTYTARRAKRKRQRLARKANR